jgi:hypothetical protein
LKYFFLPFLVLLFGCTKSETTTPQDTLPQITQVGANTAGCIINGKVLVPKNGATSFSGTPYGLNINAGIHFNQPIIGGDYWQLEIANKKDQDSAGIVLWIKNMSAGINNYQIDQSNGELYAYGPNNNQIIAGITENGINKTYYSSSNSGIIKITRFDHTNGIYSGTFNCSLYNKDNPSDIIQVTDGRFDIKIATLNH